MKPIPLGYVPVQFGDSSSSRGYGGTGGYGSSSVGSSYRGYDYPNRSTLSSYGGGIGSNSYDNYRTPSASDRTLNYLTSSGAVSSLKDKFDLSPSTSGLRGSSSGGYTSSSLDRYTGRNLGSDYSTSSSKIGSGYMSDVDLGGLGTQSYGGGTSLYSSTWSQPSSYVPSSSRTSRSDYSRPSRDLGTSYVPSSGTDASRAKSSYYSLTPFETRRTAKATDLNLTPFTSRVSGDSAKPSYDRQSSSSSTTAHDKSSAAGGVSRQLSSEEAKKTTKSKVVLSESSDSAEEPDNVSKRDPNVRYLTSRASSPMEIDRDGFDNRKPEKNRNRLVSRTKTKTYPVGDRKRRRQLKNIHVQVDGEELDKYCGRVRINRDKLSKSAAPENKIDILRYGPSVAALASTIDDKSSTPTKGSSSSVGGGVGGRTSVSTGREEPKEKPVLPKQSVFVPRDRKAPRNNFRDEDDAKDVPVNIRKTMTKKDRDRKEDVNEEDKDQVPKQSSFLERKWHQQEEAEKQAKQEKKTHKDKAAPENLSLKESIEKVKSWKMQLQHAAPDSGDEDENHLEIYGKNEWRKKKNLKNKSTNETSKDATLSPPRSIRSPSGSDKSEVGFLRDSSPNVEVSANLQKDKRKTVAGVPKFPMTSENIIDDEKQNRKQKQKPNSDRSPSPYDNLKGPGTTEQRSISPYDNLEKADGGQTGKRPLGKAFPSTDSLGGFGADVSSEDEDRRGTSSKGHRSATLLKPKVQLGSSTTSLPDLVTSSEVVRRGGFIGKLRDIDNLLGFSETEDDKKQLSESESDSSDEESSDESSTNNRKNNNNNKRPILRSGAKIVLSPVSEGKSSSNERQSVSPSRPPDDVTLVGESEDIDEILDADMVPKFLGSVTPATTPDSAHVVTNPLLHLDITQPQVDLSSSESLLDTPVPDTPDIPLSPVPAFFATKDSRKAQSMDQLNRQTDQVGRPLQMKSQDKLKQQQHHPAPPPDRTKSFGDLDDIGNIIGIANGTPKVSGKHDVAHQVRVEHQRHQRPMHRQTTVDGIPIETLVDLSFDDITDAAPGVSREMMTPVAKRFYPPGYSDTAVKEAIARHGSKGQVTISELVEICKKPLKRKPPWVEDEEDRRFAGYKEVGDALENMEVDIKKLHDCAVALYRHVGQGRSRAAYLQPQTSIECNSSDEDGATENQMTDSLKQKIHVTVGVHAFIDKLIHSSGQELRRALFSLKQIFKNDKDVVREFIYSDGLTCLVNIGTDASHSYQGYILRGLGQLMLYVDGMNGIVADNIAIQWLYMLTTSKCYPVAKTSLRLLQMFLDYSDCNAFLLLQAVSVVSHSKGLKMWSYLLDFIKQGENAGQGDLSIEAMTLLNKVLSAIPDQDTFYDMTDALEEQDLEKTMQIRMKRKGTKPELLEQFRNYDVMIREEDAQENMQLDLIENISFQKTRRIKSKTPGRRSVRYARISSSQASKNKNKKNDSKQKEADTKSTGASQMSAQFREPMKFKWRREYDDEEDEPIWSAFSKNEQQKQSAAPAEPATARHTLHLGGEGNKGSGQGLDDFPGSPPSDAGGRRCFVYKMSKQPSSGGNERESSKSGSKAQGAVFDNQGPVHMLTDKMSSGQQDGRRGVQSSQPEGDFTGLICKAKEGLSSGSRQSFICKVEPEEEKPPEKSEAEQKWEEIEKKMARALKINEMDFTDLTEVDEINYLNAQPVGGVPPIQPLGLPPPHRKLPSPFGLPPQAPPPPPMGKPPPPPAPPMMGMPPPPPPPPSGAAPGAPDKGRKTIRLHWKEARSEFFTPSGRSSDTVWSKISREMGPVKINKESYLELFESKTSDLKIKQKEGSKKELTILDAKRSNAINIGLTSLPPPRAIKTAILKMDNAVMNRESIEKILHTMLPTEEEKTKIMEAQMSQPDTPLGTAEQFLLTLSSITELQARLSLWAFTIDYETVETEISEPLSDLRMAMEELRRSRTFKYVLGTLLSVGNCLNNTQAKGFTLEILSRVPEVKDTIQKHSLLHHLVQMITEQFSDSNDLFSDLGAVNRCAKVDWDELEEKLSRMEMGCKASWDHLRAVVKHDSNTALKTKLSDTLADFAERIIVLKIIHRRILNRFHRFLLYLGYQAPDVSEVKVNAFCKTIIEFALEYRTLREKFIQAKQKKDSHQHKERRSSRAKISASEENLSKGFKKSVDLDDTYNRRSGQQSADKHLNFLDGVKLTKCPSLSKLSGQVSETESVCDTGDEDILEAVMRTASASSERRRDKRKTKDSDSKSWRSYGNTRDRYAY